MEKVVGRRWPTGKWLHLAIKYDQWSFNKHIWENGKRSNASNDIFQVKSFPNLLAFESTLKFSKVAKSLTSEFI